MLRQFASFLGSIPRIPRLKRILAAILLGGLTFALLQTREGCPLAPAHLALAKPIVMHKPNKPESAQRCLQLVSLPKQFVLTADSRNWLCDHLPADWRVPQRTITAQTLFKELKAAKGGEVHLDKTQLLVNGFSFRGQSFPAGLDIDDSVIIGSFDLSDDHLLSLGISNTLMSEDFTAVRLTLDQYLGLRTLYAEDFYFPDARVVSGILLADIACDSCDIFAQDLQAGEGLYLQGWLGSRDGFGEINFSNSSFHRVFSAIGVQTRNDLFCLTCTIAGDLNFEGDFGWEPPGTPPISAQDAGCPMPQWQDFPKSQKDSFLCRAVDFSNATIVGQFVTQNTVFNDRLILDETKLGDIYIGDGTMISQLSMAQSKIDNNFITQGSVSLHEAQLDGMTVAGKLDLDGLSQNSWTRDAILPDAPLLDLTDATVTSFTDCLASFPSNLMLHGFKYDDFDRPDPTAVEANPACGHPASNKYADLQEAGWRGWLKWLKLCDCTVSYRNLPFDPQPHLYLAHLLGDQGFTNYQNAILWRMDWAETWDDFWRWNISSWLGLFSLGLSTEFGIGHYFFFSSVIILLGSLVVSVWVLKREEKTRNLPLLWCIGASIHHLLPVVELNSKFSDFFNGKHIIYRGRVGILTHWQKVFYTCYALWGWIIGGLLVAASSNLMQGW